MKMGFLGMVRANKDERWQSDSRLVHFTTCVYGSRLRLCSFYLQQAQYICIQTWIKLRLR